MIDTKTPKRPLLTRRKAPALRPRGAAPEPPRNDAASEPPRDDARIAKVMARAGLCSRRDAEGWIAAGRVSVNGAVIASPALNVRPGDRIAVDGVPVGAREKTRLFLFHKPRGLVTTARDPEGRPTIFEALPTELPRLVSIGRLDINTEGLMLLTNDGGLSRVLELPATGWLRRYRVRANGEVSLAALEGLAKGISIDGVDYAGIEATLDRVQGANAWLTLGLREGKNREIKRVLEHLGLQVNRLIRISFGPFQLGELAEGAVEEVRTRVLAEQLGPALAAEAGVTFEEPASVPADRPREGRAGAGAGGRPLRRAEPLAKGRPAVREDAPLPRAHVSALRAARAEAEGREGRRRIERGATTDRRGRPVAVERVERVGARPAQTLGEQGRNARRFARAAEDQASPGAPRSRPFRTADPVRHNRLARPDGAGARPDRALPERQRQTRRPEAGAGANERPRGRGAARFGDAAETRDREDFRRGGRDKPRMGKSGGFGPRRGGEAGDSRRSPAGRGERPDFGGAAQAPRSFSPRARPAPRDGAPPRDGGGPKARFGRKPGAASPGRPRPGGNKGGGRGPQRG